MLNGGYYRYNMPRTDLMVKVGDVTVAPGLALGSWAGFSGTGAKAMVMGDLVLTASELKPVLRSLAEQKVMARPLRMPSYQTLGDLWIELGRGVPSRVIDYWSSSRPTLARRLGRHARAYVSQRRRFHVQRLPA